MTSQPRAEETRLRILDAAEACFAAHGYDGAGMAEICRRAGVSRGAFYHHFPSKQAVFLALLERWLLGLDVDLESARAGSQQVPEALLGMAQVARNIFQVGRGRLPLFLAFWTQAAQDPAVWQATIAPYHRYRAAFAQLIEAGVAEGSLVDVDATLGAQVLMALALGLVLQGLLDPSGSDWGAIMQRGMALLLAGMQVHK